MKLRHDFTVESFNRLSDPYSANQFLKARESSISELGNIILKHGLENDVGIRLLHKHYDLRGDEIVVATREPSKITIRPRKKMDCTVRPLIWKLHESEWYPVEFVEEHEGWTALSEQTERIAKSPAFLRDLTQKVRELGLSNVLGITLLLNGMIAMPTSYNLYERTDEITRTSILELTDKRVAGHNNDDTCWAFPKGIIVPLCNCAHKPKPGN